MFAKKGLLNGIKPNINLNFNIRIYICQCQIC